MRQSVADAFFDFTLQFEGKLPCMYLDVKGLVTTGVGNLIDPVEAALPLPWTKPDGTPATAADIHGEWGYVKSRVDLAKYGGGIFMNYTKLRLSDDAISKLVLAKLQANEAILKTKYTTYDTWPADAQLGLHSMAWAMGPYFHFPKFMAAVNCARPNFTIAAQECLIVDPGNPIDTRNKANVLLFSNAASVASWGLDYTTLWYPCTVIAPASQGGPQFSE